MYSANNKLRYGSLEKIIKAMNEGAGILYREDVEILLKEIEDLKEIIISMDD